MKVEKKRLLKNYHELLNLRIEKCLFPGMKCENQTIGAHSIQNANIFDLLQYKGHVTGFKFRAKGAEKPKIEFSSIGRNQASTFHGLCAEHDNILFEKIDKYPIDIQDNEQLFLYAYRAILHELHACMTRSAQYQKMYNEKINLGLISGNNPTNEGQLAKEAHLISYETFLYKEMCEEILLNKNFTAICHEVLDFKTQMPTIACSQLFSIDTFIHEDYVLRGIINIIPISEFKTLVIFSFTQEEFTKGKDAVHKCLRGENNDLKMYEISKFLLEKVGNIFINPFYFEQWSTGKKNTISNYYNKTIIDDFDFDHSDLMLFE